MKTRTQVVISSYYKKKKLSNCSNPKLEHISAYNIIDYLNEYNIFVLKIASLKKKDALFAVTIGYTGQRNITKYIHMNC